MSEMWKARVSALSQRMLLEPAPKVESALRQLLNDERVILDDDVVRDFAEKISHGVRISPR
ncbi:hypothetical protein [Leifsonia sp. WHRI 6310E]|uniref:hypothetical protein n=1 Tax=Leifsonia sp. WHRI 6310E TaxID=3162562 RepID=UPI0032EEC488